MRFVLTIDCDNAAFERPGLRREVARILMRVAKEKLPNGYDDGKLLDINGNTVGRFGFEKDE